MNCPRCGKNMFHTRFYGREANEVNSFDGWKCIYCGEIIDILILENRMYGGIEKQRDVICIGFPKK